MPLIDSVSKAGIMQRAQQGLVKRTLGGVTQESAINAINQATNEAVVEGNKRIASLELEVRDKDSRIYSLRESLDNETSKLEQATQVAQELKDKLTVINEQFAKANAIKVGKPKTLPNGNIETIRVNRNGFRETTETLADGRKVSKKFETIDGDVLKITYNPVTGEPLKAFSNVNGDTLTEYKDGKATAAKPVNNKKVTPKKPELINTEIVKDESNRSNGISEIRRSYSDGSYDTIIYSHYKQHPLKEIKINKDGKVFQETEYKFYDHYKIANTRIIDIEKNRAQLIIGKKIFDEGFEPDYTHVKEDYRFLDDKNQTIKKVVKYNNGLVRIIEAKKDEYGFADTSNPSLTIIYPKTSKIKSSEVKYRTQFHVSKEILKMKDGSTVTMSVDSNYRPYDVVITDKEGNQKILDTREEIFEYMKSISKNAGLESGDYYYNAL